MTSEGNTPLPDRPARGKSGPPPATAASFFVVGGTMRPGARSYVERSADRDLLEALRRSEFCYVLDTRQMGKSSLMARVASQLRRDCAVVTIDLTAFGSSLPLDQWYDSQISAIGRQLDLEDEIEEFIDRHAGLGPLDRWVQVIRDVVLEKAGKPVIIFVDEIDFVRALPFPTDEFFAGIRHFYNARAVDPRLEKLTFCLLGVSTPTDLIRSEEVTPFNLGRRIVISDFEFSDAEKVLLPGLHSDPETARKILKRVFYWTDGHPYLTQRICETVAQRPGASTADDVDEACASLFFAPGAREQNDNLRFVSNRLLVAGSEADALDLYSKVRRGEKIPDDGKQPFAETLRLSGVAKAVDGYFRVRNQVYRHVFDQKWIDENMPDQEIRRMAEVARRVRNRTILIALGVLLLLAMIVLAIYLQLTTMTQQTQIKQMQILNTELKASEADAKRQRDDAKAQKDLATEAANRATQAEAEEAKQEALAKGEAARALTLEKENSKLSDDAVKAARKDSDNADQQRKDSDAARVLAEKNASDLKAAKADVDLKNTQLTQQGVDLTKEKARADTLQLAATAEMLRATQPGSEISALLAVQAGGREWIPQSAQVLRSIASQLPRSTAPLALSPGSGRPDVVKLSPNRRYLVMASTSVGGTSGTLYRICGLDLNGSLPAACAALPDSPDDTAVTNDGLVTVVIETPLQILKGSLGRGTLTMDKVSLTFPAQDIEDSALSANGCRLAVDKIFDEVLTVLDLCGKLPPVRLTRNKVLNTLIGVDPTGAYVLTESIGSRLSYSLWDVDRKTVIRELPLQDCASKIRTSSDLTQIYCGDQNTGRLIHVDRSPGAKRTAAVQAQMADQGFPDGSSAVAFSSDNRFLARATRSGVQIWLGGKQVGSSLPITEGVKSMEFNASPDLIAVTTLVGSQQLVRVYDFGGTEQSRLSLPGGLETFFTSTQFGVITEDFKLRLVTPRNAGLTTPINTGTLVRGGIFAQAGNGQALVSGATKGSRVAIYDLTDASGAKLRESSQPFAGGLEAFSNDGTLLMASDSNQRQVALGPAPNLAASFVPVNGTIRAISPNGSLIAFSNSSSLCSNTFQTSQAAAAVCTLTLYERTTGIQRTFPVNPEVAAFSPDGTTLNTIAGGVVQTWDVAGSAERSVQRLASSSRGAKFSLDGSTALIPTASGPGLEWNARSGTVSPLTRPLSGNFALSPDGQRFATAIDAGRLAIIGLSGMKEVIAAVASATSKTLRFSHSGTRIAAFGSGSLQMIAADGAETPRSTAIPGVLGGVLLGFSADDSRVAISANGRIAWYRSDTLAPVPGAITTAALSSPLLSPDGRWLALVTSSTAGSAPRVRSLESQAALLTTDLPVSAPTAMAVSEGTGVKLAYGDLDGTVHFVSDTPGFSKAAVVGNGPPVTVVTWSPDARYVVAGGARQVSLFTPADGNRVAQSLLDGSVSGLAFSQNGSILTATEQGAISILRVPGLESGGRVASQQQGAPVSAVVSGPAGETAVTVSPEFFRLWSTRDWTVRGEVRARILPGIKFSAKGELLAARTDARAVGIWTLAGSPIAEIKTDYDIIAFAFNVDHTVLATASPNVVELWRTDQVAPPGTRLITSIPSTQGIADIAFDTRSDDLIVGVTSGSGFITPWRAEKLIPDICGRIFRSTKLSQPEINTYLSGDKYVDYCAAPGQIGKN